MLFFSDPCQDFLDVLQEEVEVERVEKVKAVPPTEQELGRLVHLHRTYYWREICSCCAGWTTPTSCRVVCEVKPSGCGA
jgi:hypothetical protein